MSSVVAVVSLILLVLQFGLQPFLTQTFLQFTTIKSTTVVTIELLKFTICVLTLFFTVEGSNVIERTLFDLICSSHVANRYFFWLFLAEKCTSWEYLGRTKLITLVNP